MDYSLSLLDGSTVALGLGNRDVSGIWSERWDRNHSVWSRRVQRSQLSRYPTAKYPGETSMKRKFKNSQCQETDVDTRGCAIPIRPALFRCRAYIDIGEKNNSNIDRSHNQTLRSDGYRGRPKAWLDGTLENEPVLSFEPFSGRPKSITVVVRRMQLAPSIILPFTKFGRCIRGTSWGK